MGRLDGTVALVTGGSGGIGRASAMELAREGADVAVHYRSGRSAAEAVAAQIRGLGRKSVALEADVSSPASCRGCVSSAVKALGSVDVLVAMAGHPFRPEEWSRDYLALGPDDLRKPLEVDLLGSVYMTQAVLPGLVARGSGSIVLVGSTPALTGDVVGIPYLVAKAGVLALTRALAQVYGPKGIRVNAVALGSIDSEAMAVLPAEEKAALAAEPALKRRGRMEEVARTVAFLASADASFITGQTVVVDGGYALR